MRRGMLLLLVLVAVALIGWFVLGNKKEKPAKVKQQPVAVSQHSAPFNSSMNNALSAYTNLTEAFVNWDTAAVSKEATAMQSAIKNLNFDELKKDTVIYETAISYLDGFNVDLNSIRTEKDITQKRQSLNSFSQNFYDLLRTVRYDQNKLYLQECPMAFNNETEPGIWLSRNETIHNPYMGLHHPKYGKAMLECGDVKDTLNFTPAATK